MKDGKSMAQCAYDFLKSLPPTEHIPFKIKTINEDDKELWVILKNKHPEKFEKNEQRKTPWATLDAQLRQDTRFVVKNSFTYLKEWGELKLPKQDDVGDNEGISDIKEQELQERLFDVWKSTKLRMFGFDDLELINVEEQENKKGKFDTGEVGEMDFLFLDSFDNYVVIELKRKEDDKAVGQLLRYMGWVKKNLCKDKQEVKGVIITREITQKLLYASEIINRIGIKIYPWIGK